MREKPLRQIRYRVDFSSLSDKDVQNGLDFLEKLSCCICLDEPQVVDLWEVFSGMRGRLISEKADRERTKYIKHQKGEIGKVRKVSVKRVKGKYLTK